MIAPPAPDMAAPPPARTRRPPVTAPTPRPKAVPAAAPAPSWGAPEIRPAAMPGPKMPSIRRDSAASTVDKACSRLMSGPVKELVKALNTVEPMPTITASTISLMPEETTLPRTFSAKKDVLFQRAKGTSTNPASVVSLNSKIVMKSWMARIKKARSTIAQANIKTAMVMKF